MGKVIVVNVHCDSGYTYVTDSYYWHKDSGNQLVINGLGLKTGAQVHFSLTEKNGVPVPMFGVEENGVFIVDLPNRILQDVRKRADYEIYAFVYNTSETGGWTEHEIIIPVHIRPSLPYENPTDEDLTAFDRAVELVKGYAEFTQTTAENFEADREQIWKNAEDIEYLKEHGVGGGDSEDYKLPQATETNLGGVKASPKTDNDTVEAKIGADGKLYVPTYQEQNEIPVDSALDKTSTNPIQNKAVAEAVEKLSNDKLNANALPDAINTALTQAKESGAFDGTNGTTPHIGANGNWFIGESDTGVSATGETTSITVDDKLNKESTNPIQNKTVAEAIDKLSEEKVDIESIGLAFGTDGKLYVSIGGKTVGSGVTVSEGSTDEPETPDEPEVPTQIGNIVILTESVDIEPNSTATFTVSLDKSPESEQTVTITSSNDNVTVEPSVLVFDSTNYNVNQTVIISASDMEDTYDILLTLSSAGVADRYINVNVESIPEMPEIALMTADASDFTYYISGNKIYLKSYIGDKTAIDIPTTMTVEGTEYNVGINYAGMGYSNTTGLFSGNISLEAVRFAESLECYTGNKKADYMFYGCTNLKAVWNMPEVTSLISCFESCSSFVGVTGLDKSNNIVSMKNAFRKCYSMAVSPKFGNLASVTILQGSFEECSSLKTMPNISSATACTTLEKVCMKCTSMKKFRNIDALTKVVSLMSAFSHCPHFSEMPNIANWTELTRIDHAFNNTSVTEIKDIPSGVTNMTYAFYGCTGLTGIANIYAEEVTNGTHCFENTESTLIVRMVAGSTTYNTFTSLNVGDTDGLSKYVIFKTFDESIDIPQIALCGDSLFAYSQPSIFNDMVATNGAVAYSFAFAGYTSYEIAAKQGGIPMQIATAVTIPADTSAVPIEITNEDGYSFPKSTSHTASNGNNPCYVAGIECKFSTDGNNWYIARTESGEAVEVKAGTIIETSQMKYHNTDIMAIFMGQNGVWATPDDLISQYIRMIQYSENGGKYVVVGLHSGTASERAELETAMAEEFEEHYINLRKYFVENGLADAGLTPTEEDISAMALGKTPPSLMADGLHLNTYGATIMWTLIYNKMISFGYIS